MIFTFYSYKGGVGRSMALANMAQWFYDKGLRVVIVDWDLEAPGLENFFYASPKEIERVRSRLGLIDLLSAYKREYPYLSRVESSVSAASAGLESDDISEQLQLTVLTQLDDHEFSQRLQVLPPLSDTWTEVKPEKVSGGSTPSPSDRRSLRLISAGWRAGDRFADYAREVQDFNWSDFFQSFRGKSFFEWFRNELERDNDIVLIDSRTGVTEMSGVCTQELADVVVSFCVPNVQNLTGVARMITAFMRDELKAVRLPRPLPKIAIVPTRIENSEDDLKAKFKEEFYETLQGLRDGNQDLSMDPDSAWWLRIPYIPKYAYAEKLAKDKDAMRRTILLWLSYWRDVLLQTARAETPLTNADRAPEIVALAARLDLSTARRVVADLEQALARLERNVNARLLAEVLLLDWPAP